MNILISFKFCDRLYINKNRNGIFQMFLYMKSISINLNLENLYKYRENKYKFADLDKIFISNSFFHPKLYFIYFVCFSIEI